MIRAPHVIENESWQVGLLPATGMSTAFGRVKHRGAFVDLLRPTPETSYAHPSDCASHLLIPWSNRVKGGRFTFRGKEHRLRVNLADGSAIHGTARDYPWDVAQADPRGLIAQFDSREHEDANFPFAFSARAEFRVDGPRFSSRLSVKNEGGEPMPAGLGHHPYFARCFAGAHDAVRVAIPCERYFELDACIPSAAPVPVDPRVDFRSPRALDPDAALDDCLTGRRAGVPIRLAYPQSGLRISFELDPLFENVVVYVPRGDPYFAVEPASNANDGFNLYEQGIAGSGVFILEPGEERAATVAWCVDG